MTRKITRAEAEDAAAAVADAMLAVWNAHGWLQSSLGDDRRGYCMKGAWMRATGQLAPNGNVTRNEDYELNEAFRKAARQAIADLFPGYPDSLNYTSFNDDPRHTEEDVKIVAKHALAHLPDLMDLAD